LQSGTSVKRWPKNSRVCYEEGKKIGKDGVAAF